MLRIKPEVDLKELEKFGFDTSASLTVQGDKIDFSNRWVDDHLGMTVGGGLVVWDKSREIVRWGFDPDLELLYDLIEAGLVEKVRVEKMEEATRGSYEVKSIVRPTNSNQKTAKEMFEELGYHCWKENVDVVVFHKVVHPVLGNKEIEFYKGNKLIRVYGMYNDRPEPFDFKMQELEAINQMCKELGWLDE